MNDRIQSNIDLVSPKLDGQLVEQDGVISRVEGGTHIKHCKQLDVSLVHWREKVGQYAK